jgi:tetratricopeptide (TPR) repeat protein
LLTDFVNTTADPVFDGTLKKALAVDLEQSPYLNVFPERKVQQTLQFMGRASDERISSEIGREICQRNGIRAMLIGSIANLGNQYVITLEATNAANGDALAREQIQSSRKEEVLNALHKATSALRGKLGESLASVQKFDKPLSEATTSSLQALKAFTLGDMKHSAGLELEALPNYQRAVELDPNFAMAYARLGAVYNNLGQSQLSEQNRQKAFELRDRTSEREKLYIMSHYYADAGQLDKGITALELYKQTYPRDYIPSNNLASIYLQLGQFENALQNASLSIQTDPSSGSGYENQAAAYMGLNRLDEAKATVASAFQHNLNFPSLHIMSATLAWAQGDDATLEKELQLAAAAPNGEYMVLGYRAALAGARGQLKHAREFIRKANDAAARLNLKESVPLMLAQQADLEVLVGNRAQAVSWATDALKLSNSPQVETSAAYALAISGEEKKALSLADDTSRRRPNDTMAQFVYVPLIRTLVELQHGQTAKAIDLLDAAAVYGRANAGVIYVRGSTYLKAKQGAEAAQEFQKILDKKAWFGVDVLVPLARLGLARAYALQGDNAKSRVAYQDFFASWKAADPDIPVLRQARVEYDKVK